MMSGRSRFAKPKMIGESFLPVLAYLLSSAFDLSPPPRIPGPAACLVHAFLPPRTSRLRDSPSWSGTREAETLIEGRPWATCGRRYLNGAFFPLICVQGKDLMHVDYVTCALAAWNRG